MDGRTIEVPLDALLAAGAAAAAAAGAVGDVDVGTPMAALTAGMPGGAAALAAARAVAEWTGVLASLAELLGTHAVALTESASAYQEVETLVARLMRAAG